MIDPLLDAATHVLDLATDAAAHAEVGERADVTAERDALRQASRDVAVAAQALANAEESHARGRVRKPRAASPRLYALKEAAAHLKQLIEQSITGPPEVGGAVARPVQLSDLTDAQLRNAAQWLDTLGGLASDVLNYTIGAAATRAYLSERIADREHGSP